MKTNGETGESLRPRPDDHEVNNGNRAPVKSRAILVPVEGLSETAKKAMQYAIPFARHLNARIIFLHILPTHSSPGWRYDGVNHEWYFDAQVQRDREEKLAAFARNASPEDVPVEIEVRYGEPTSNIVNVARDMDVDMIIMCTHAHKGWLHVLMGSVASVVVRHAPCPVLVVREHEHEFTLDDPAVFKAN